MFIGAGAVNGVRIVKPETMSLMMTNQLSETHSASARMFRKPLFDGHGFGLGVAVVMDRDKAAPTLCSGAIGTVGWPAAFGG